jgi:hypothetical protein
VAAGPTCTFIKKERFHTMAGMRMEMRDRESKKKGMGIEKGKKRRKDYRIK